MRKHFSVALFGIIALVFTLSPALGQQSVEKFAGTYEFDAPDFGPVSIYVEMTESSMLTLSAMDSPPLELVHIEGNMYEIDSP